MHPRSAYRMPDHDRRREQQLLAAFEEGIARQRADDRRRIRRARYTGFIVSGICAALFALAMAESLVKQGLAANALEPLLACAAVVLVLALLVRRARLFLRHRADASRQKLDIEIAELVAEQVRAAAEAAAAPAGVADSHGVAETPARPTAPAETQVS